MTGGPRTRLYALSAVACAAWLAQQVYSAARQGQLLYWPNAILFVCLLIFIGYAGYSAVDGWRKEKAAKDEGSKGAKRPGN